MGSYMEITRSTSLERSTDGREWTSDLISVLEERFRDPAGGYFEGLTEEWATPAAGAGLLVGDPSHKTISTHLNALNTLANAHSRGYADLSTQIGELIELVEVQAEPRQFEFIKNVEGTAVVRPGFLGLPTDKSLELGVVGRSGDRKLQNLRIESLRQVLSQWTTRGVALAVDNGDPVVGDGRDRKRKPGPAVF